MQLGMLVSSVQKTYNMLHAAIRLAQSAARTKKKFDEIMLSFDREYNEHFQAIKQRASRSNEFLSSYDVMQECDELEHIIIQAMNVKTQINNLLKANTVTNILTYFPFFNEALTGKLDACIQQCTAIKFILEGEREVQYALSRACRKAVRAQEKRLSSLVDIIHFEMTNIKINNMTETLVPSYNLVFNEQLVIIDGFNTLQEQAIVVLNALGTADYSKLRHAFNRARYNSEPLMQYKNILCQKLDVVEDVVRAAMFDRIEHTILAMQGYGYTLQKQAKEKGKAIINLAEELQNMIDELEKNPITPERWNAFKHSFNTKLHSLDKDMAQHRAKWKPIIANIIIAFTGIGTLLLLGRVVSDAYSQKGITFKTLFFANTTREEKVSAIADSLNKSAPVTF